MLISLHNMLTFFVFYYFFFILNFLCLLQFHFVSSLSLCLSTCLCLCLSLFLLHTNTVYSTLLFIKHSYILLRTHARTHSASNPNNHREFQNPRWGMYQNVIVFSPKTFCATRGSSPTSYVRPMAKHRTQNVLHSPCMFCTYVFLYRDTAFSGRR